MNKINDYRERLVKMFPDEADQIAKASDRVLEILIGFEDLTKEKKEVFISFLEEKIAFRAENKEKSNDYSKA